MKIINERSSLKSKMKISKNVNNSLRVNDVWKLKKKL